MTPKESAPDEPWRTMRACDQTEISALDGQWKAWATHTRGFRESCSESLSSSQGLPGHLAAALEGSGATNTRQVCAPNNTRSVSSMSVDIRAELDAEGLLRLNNGDERHELTGQVLLSAIRDSERGGSMGLGGLLECCCKFLSAR